MDGMTDPIDLLDRALGQVAAVLDGASFADPGTPTPCRDWTLDRLVNHVVFDTGQFTNVATGGRADWSLTAPPVDPPYGEPFRLGADRLVAAWRAAGDPDRIMTVPIGERTARFVLTQQTAEFAVHAWDIARATGQAVAWDDEVAETALAWSKTTLLPAFRGDGKPFGDEVPVPADAPAQDRLVAWFGRRPS
jgi:uncharacterized protein (TIGR03086 family)